MLDIKYLTENIDKVSAILKNRSGTYDLEKVRELNNCRKTLLAEAEKLKAERNSLSAAIAGLKREGKNADGEAARSKALGEKIKDLDEKTAEAEAGLRELVLSIPNLPNAGVPVGRDESANVEVRRVGEPPVFDFSPRPHWELGEEKGIFDQPTAAKITGARFTVYRGYGARLERAVTNFMLDTHTADGFTEIFPPFMVNRESMTGTGQLPKFEEDAFSVKNTNYFLVPTAEVPVTNMHRDEVLDGSRLPLYYTAYTACFRAEAGSAGRDTRGLIRQHQFNKVELVKFSRPEHSYQELESLTMQAEKVLKLLKLPYRVVALSTGDLGFASAKTYDIEVWMPSYNKYVEISSCSNFEDFQARRMNIKYRSSFSEKPAFVHTLNGSGLAVGRTTAAIMENFQNADGSVTVPDVLVKYMGVDRF